MPDAPAEEWVAYEDEGEEITVAEDNPEYPADGRVVVVVFGNTVDYKLPDWNRISPLSPTESASDEAEEADQSEEAEESEAEGESTAEPSAAIVALQRYLKADGMEADIADDRQSVRVTTADDSYRVSLDGVEGDGAHRSQLEEAAEKVRAATEATTE